MTREPYCKNGHYEEHDRLPECIDELLAAKPDAAVGYDDEDDEEAQAARIYAREVRLIDVRQAR